MTISTTDCRAFIVDFEKRNPQIETERFEDELDDEMVAALAVPANWKRQHKVRPASRTGDHDPKTTYGVYVDGAPVNRHVDHQTIVAASEIAWERRFDCAPFEGQVAYLILETHDGRLLFGEYVGD